MSEKGRVFTRRMDDLGNINIPKEIQKELGLKATELPEFSISVNQNEKSIRIVPVRPQQVKGFVVEDERKTQDGTVICKGPWSNSIYEEKEETR